TFLQPARVATSLASDRLVDCHLAMITAHLPSSFPPFLFPPFLLSSTPLPPFLHSSRNSTRQPPAKCCTAPASCTGCCAACRSLRPSARCSSCARAACR